MPNAAANRTATRRPPAAGRLAQALSLGCAALLCFSTSPGCYDEAKLLDGARSAAQRTRLAEIDLGTYHTTMPMDRGSNKLTEVELHVFGAVPRYRVPAVEKQIKTEDYRLRHELLAAVRDAKPAELAEPDLAQLRSRIEKVVNAFLAESPVQAVGFYDVRVTYH